MNENDKKRLLMRSCRRGTKEMDIILGTFANAKLDELSADELECYELLLNENDQDLYQWVTGGDTAPIGLASLIDQISQFAKVRLAPAREE